MKTRAFWEETAGRAVRTAAQVAAAILVTSAVSGGVDVRAVDWLEVGSVTAGAALLSVLTSLAGGKRTGTPALKSPKREPEILFSDPLDNQE